MDTVLQKQYRNNSFINVCLYLFFLAIAFYAGYTTHKLLIPVIYGVLFSILLIVEIKAIIRKTYSKTLFLTRN